MPERTSPEVAHTLVESDDGTARSLRIELTEVAEAFVISLVVLATAWCGYQSSTWEGRQAFRYATSSRLRVEAGAAATQGGQQRLVDVVTFNTWIVAKEGKNEQLAALYARRFSPEFRIALEAWLSTEPFTKPDAPAGPLWMAEYHNALLEQSERLNTEATAALTDGTEAREIAEGYIRVSLLAATIVVLVAIAQRFKLRNVRIAVLLVASVLTVYVLGSVARYPRL